MPGSIRPRESARASLHKRRDEEDAQYQIGYGRLKIGGGDPRLVVQDHQRHHVTELLEHARDHEGAEPDRIGTDDEKRKLPRHGDRQEAVEKMRILCRRRVPTPRHVDEPVERRQHGDAPYTGTDEHVFGEFHNSAPSRRTPTTSTKRGGLYLSRTERNHLFR